MELLPFLILTSPFTALPKIFLGQIWLALLFDLLFLILVGKVFLRKKYEPVPFGVAAAVGALNAIAIFEILNPGLQGLYNALHGYRSTGLYMLAMYIPLLVTIKDQELRKIIRFLIIVAVFSSLNAMRQYVAPLGVEIDYADTAGGAAKFMGDEFQGDSGSFRPFSTFVTSVHLALYLGVALIASYFGRGKGFFSKLAPLVIVGGIVITLSRTAYLAILGMVGVMYCVGVFAGAVKIGRTIVVVVVFLLVGLVATVSSDLILARIMTLTNVEDVSSFQSRFELWADAVSNIESSPMGFGTGAASWAFKDSLGLGCDSGYLKAFVEFGWFGGAFFILFLMYVFYVSVRTQYKIFRVAKAGRNMPVGNVWLLASAGLVQTNFIQMFTNQTLEAYPNNFLFWLSCGFLLMWKRYFLNERAQLPVSNYR